VQGVGCPDHVGRLPEVIGPVVDLFLFKASNDERLLQPRAFWRSRVPDPSDLAAECFDLGSEPSICADVLGSSCLRPNGLQAVSRYRTLTLAACWYCGASASIGMGTTRSTPSTRACI